MKFGTKSVLLACVLLVGLSFAQVAANNLINVNVSNIKTEIAKNINVNVSQIPVTVQAPIDVAAAVCGVSVDVLTAQGIQEHFEQVGWVTAILHAGRGRRVDLFELAVSLVADVHTQQPR